MHASLTGRRLVIVQQLNVEMIGTMMLSAVLRNRGHDCRLVLGMRTRDLVREVADLRPSAVGFSTRTGQHVWCLRAAERIREAIRVPVVFGGPHATHYPEVIHNPQVDFVIRGEAETAIVEFMEMLAGRRGREEVPNLVYLDGDGRMVRNPLAPLVADLDDLPFADREFAYRHPFLRAYPSKTFIGGRGCPHRCAFCHNHLDAGMYPGQRFLRSMSPRRFVEEMEEVCRRYPVATLNLENQDDFLLDREWAARVLERIAGRIARPYLIGTRPDHIDAGTARMLEETGCAGVSLGVESANDVLRNEVLAKNISRPAIRQAVELLHRHRIPIKVFFMLGVPGEKLEDSFANLEMAARIRPRMAYCSMATPYPRTRLWEIAREQGLLPTDFSVDSIDQTYFKASVFNLPDIHRMENLQKFFFVAARHPWMVPLVRRLVRLPPNKVFTALGLGWYTLYAARYERHNVLELARLARENLRYAWSELFGDGERAGA